MSSALFHLRSTLQWYVYMQSDDCSRDHCAIFNFEMTRNRLFRVVNCVISIVVTAECPPPGGEGGRFDATLFCPRSLGPDGGRRHRGRRLLPAGRILSIFWPPLRFAVHRNSSEEISHVLHCQVCAGGQCEIYRASSVVGGCILIFRKYGQGGVHVTGSSEYM